MIKFRWLASFIVGSVGVFFIGSYSLAILDSYRFHRHPPPLGKYEEIARWLDVYHRWYQVTPPTYAKIFLPENSF